MYRFALVGAGFIGGVHAANLSSHPAVDFALVYDVDTGRAKELAQQHNSGVGSSLDEVINSDVDAVLIASSTDTHAEYLRRFAAAGIAILCEKPIDLDLKRAADAVRDVQRYGVTAMVDFNRRSTATTPNCTASSPQVRSARCRWSR